MKTKIIRISNSQGVRIPKPLLEQSGISEEIEMVLKDNEIILRSADTIRKNWDTCFEKIAEKEDDTLLDQEEIEIPSYWDETEWEW